MDKTKERDLGFQGQQTEGRYIYGGRVGLSLCRSIVGLVLRLITITCQGRGPGCPHFSGVPAHSQMRELWGGFSCTC